MAEHCCTTMSRQVEETIAAQAFAGRGLVLYDSRQRTYGLAIPDAGPGSFVPIRYCPWCAAKLRIVRARGLDVMTPDTCRAVRKAVSLTQRQLADAIGEPLATVFGYEAGKPTDAAVVAKLLDFFQGYQIAADRSGRIGFYQT